MRKNSIKLTLLFLLSALLLLTSCMFIFSLRDARAFSVEYVETEIQEYYDLGQNFVSPEANVKADDVSYASTKQVLYYPDGRAFSAEEYVLSNPGKYSLRYYAEDSNGKSIYAQDEFIVKNSAYSVSGPTSSVYYGNTGEKGNLDGLIVSVAPGDVFTYGKPIDITNRKKTEKIISLFAIPEREGSADVREFNIRFTDVADASNFIEIVVYANSGDDNEVQGQPLYYGARASNQTFSGMHYKGYAPDPSYHILYDNNYYSVYKDINFTARVGYPSFGSSLAASKGYGYKQDTDWRLPFSFAFDYAERKLYGAENQTEQAWGRKDSNRLVADFDDSLFFDELWDGFTTGEVYISVYSGNYVNSAFNFVITDIYEEDLSKSVYEEENAPKILVDFPNGELPYAVKNTSYNVFNAKAYSATDGEVYCQTLVYSDYYSNSRKLVDVKNGAFTPNDSSLSYSIVYTAIDSFGNYAEKIVDIEVKDSRIVTLDLIGEQASILTGVKTLLKQPEIKNTNGQYTLSVKAFLGETEYPVTINNNGEYEFYTLIAGDYDIKYVLTDYNGDITEEYVVTVEENANSVFVGESSLPKVFVKGASYSIPEVYGKAFNNGEITDLTASVKYAFDNGEATEYAYGEKVTVTASEKVSVIYSLENALSNYVVDIPVVDVGLESGSFKKEAYFYSEQFTAEASESALLYTIDQEVNPAEQAELYYVKPLLVTEFNLNYKFVANSNFDKAIFKFTDTADATNVLEVELKTVNEQKILVSVNGSTPREISQAICEQDRSLSFDCIMNTLTIDGNVFEVKGVKDFAEKSAMFELKLVGITGNLGLNIQKVGNYSMNDQTSDYTAPVGYIDINDGKKVIGDKIIISGLYIEDVIRFDKSAKLTVKAPNGSVCKSVDGVTMKDVKDFSKIYEIVVDQLGTYVISGTYSDGSNSQRFNLEINVYDEVAPVITITETEKINAAYVGGTYSLASATATDNNNGNVDVLVMVLDSAGKVHVIKDSKFTFTRKGVHKVMYRATDSFGNVAFESYDIVAVEKEG